jgi:hypothetical protein
MNRQDTTSLATLADTLDAPDELTCRRLLALLQGGGPDVPAA